MKVKSGLAVFVAVAMIGSATPASAAVVASFWGVVASGVDADGLFGTAGADLTGKEYSVDFTFDKSLAASSTMFPGLFEEVVGVDGGPSPMLELVVTIDGISKSLTQSNNAATIYTDAGDSWNPSFVNYYAKFDFNDGTIDLDGFVSFSGLGGGSLLVDQNVNPTPLSNLYGLFEYNSVLEFNWESGQYELVSGTQITFGSRSDSFRPSYQVTGGFSPPVDEPGVDPVPEPASWAMPIAGFGLVGATLRRRRMVAA